jgi:hypothetical protein
MATRIPSLPQRRFVGVKQTTPAVTALFAPEKGRGPEISLHGAQTEPEVLGNRGEGPPVAVQRPDLLM